GKLNFQYYFLKGIKLGKTLLNYEIIKFLKGQYDLIIITNQSSLTGILSILYLNIKNKSYILEADGGFPQRQKGIKKLVKNFVIKNADYLLSSSKITDDYFIC